MNKSLDVTRIANVHFFEFPKNFRTEEDQHAFCELLFVNNGILSVYSDDYTGKLKKNELIIHLTNKKHSLECPDNNLTTVIIIGFECNSEQLKYFADKPITLDEREIKQLAEIVKEGRNVFAPPYNVPVYNMQKKQVQTFGSEQELNILLEYFLINLIRKYGFSITNNNEEQITFQTKEIIQYLSANFKEKITIDELAFIFHTNRTTLCKEFKKATNTTIIEYLSKLKIKEAKKLLIQNKFSISKISEALNFDTDSHFCSFFKKMTGVTPIEFRKKNNL